MKIHRAHVLLPDDLRRDIDALVGPRGRSSFLVETARQEVHRRKLLLLLKADPAWKDENHPELAGGTPGWVRTLRAQSDRSRRRKKN